MPARRKAVRFDIDGTLTTSDAELVKGLAGGGALAVQTDATNVARHWAGKRTSPN